MKIRMSLLVPVLTGLAIWASSVAAQSKTEGTSSKIIALENKWNAAYNPGDIATMESLLAEDFIITVDQEHGESLLAGNGPRRASEPAHGAGD